MKTEKSLKIEHSARRSPRLSLMSARFDLGFLSISAAAVRAKIEELRAEEEQNGVSTE